MLRAVTGSIKPFIGCFRRQPLRHMTADRRRLNVTRVLNQQRTWLYGSALFSLNLIASFLINVLVSGLQPPDVENTKGVKLPFSAITLASYFLRFLAFLPTIELGQRDVCGRAGEQVKHPHIEKCHLMPPTPEASCAYVEPSELTFAWFFSLLFLWWFQVWLCRDINAHFRHWRSYQITYLIVAYCRKPSSWAW